MALQDESMTHRPLAELNDRLAPNGYTFLANKRQDAMPVVMCTGEDEWLKQGGLSVLRLLFSQEVGRRE